MELFKFNFATDPTVLERGESINGAKSIMWAERYLEPGEFEITGKLSSGLLSFLPIGTLLSHADTYEVMIVENHEIKEDPDEDPNIVITGRSFESILEQRIVGVNQAYANNLIVEYALGAYSTWAQASQMIIDHIVSPSDANDVLTNIGCITDVTGTGTIEARVFKRGPLLQRVQELLAIDDLGIKTIRRSTFPGGNPSQTVISVYRGKSKASTVIFSWKSGDLGAVDYLWSDKSNKNAALVVGRYVNVRVHTGPTKYSRRYMLVDANDIDGNLSAPPAGAALTDVVNKMLVRGNAAIKDQKRLTITRADISNLSKYDYRKDYNVGDLITLDANFGQIATMRVVEFVEIEDENGESGHPTLSVPTSGLSGFFLD